MISAKSQLPATLDGFRAARTIPQQTVDIAGTPGSTGRHSPAPAPGPVCNPLTHLPGSPGIEAEVNRRLAAQTPFAFAYLDIDHFKAFNDVYGYPRGPRDPAGGPSARRSPNPSEGEPAFADTSAAMNFVFISSPQHLAGVLPDPFEIRCVGADFYSRADRQGEAYDQGTAKGQPEFFPLSGYPPPPSIPRTGDHPLPAADRNHRKSNAASSRWTTLIEACSFGTTARSTSAPPMKPRILLIDDDPTVQRSSPMRSLTSIIWRRHSGAELPEVLSGFGPADHPGRGSAWINGFDLCRDLRQIPRWKDIPILFLSGYASDKTSSKAMRPAAIATSRNLSMSWICAAP